MHPLFIYPFKSDFSKTEIDLGSGFLTRESGDP